ncbi:hypothetical protein A7M79_00690 [Acinetobacter baumannii]|uniref:hypothetical protein n=1 Tax=Acinetobacter baumannii TaxID=470 RepID=UPI0008DC8C99|nr:hypothetical protein [Acinetobacter baumannii]OIH12040.1 hypothetical protein A7M79_00690 [Acinetobacter baumannii]
MKTEKGTANILFDDNLELDNYNNDAFIMDANIESEVSLISESVKSLSLKTKKLNSGFRHKDFREIEEESQENSIRISKAKNAVSLKLKELDIATSKAISNINKIESRGDFKNNEVLEYNKIKKSEAEILKTKYINHLDILTAADNSLLDLSGLLEAVVGGVDRERLLKDKLTHINKIYMGYNAVQIICMTICFFSFYYFFVNKISNYLVFYSLGSAIFAGLSIFFWGTAILSLILLLFRPSEDIRYKNVSLAEVNDNQRYLQLTFYFKDFFKRRREPFYKRSVICSYILFTVSVLMSGIALFTGDSVVAFKTASSLSFILPLLFIVFFSLFYFFKSRFSSLIISSIEDIADLGFNSSDVKKILEN